MTRKQEALKLASSDPVGAFDRLLGQPSKTAKVELSPTVEGIIAELPTIARKLIIVSRQDESKLMLVLGTLVTQLAAIVGSFPELENEAAMLSKAGLRVMRGRSKV
jgi:hypothetical protein